MSNEQTAVCKLSEINDGEMKQVQMGETPVLLARVNGECFALAAHCTHYGAPLAEGALVGDRIICPWHHACFHVTNGDMIEPPALDSLPSFPVRIEGDDIFVDLPADPPDRREPTMAEPYAKADDRIFVIIGGGAAGYAAAQTLREDGFKGRIVMITAEDRLPYDRPNLSKDYLHGHADPEWMPLRPEDFYGSHSIEVMRGRKVAAVEKGKKEIKLESGEIIEFDGLLIATGGVPRTLSVPGADLKNILALRSFESADTIIAAADKATNVAIIGASFIGMEAAFSLKTHGNNVTVIAPDKVPFERTFGTEIGEMFRELHEANGVQFRLGASVKGFEGNGTVNRVLLESGDPVDADLVIVGVGVRPATDFLKGFESHKDGGVIADRNLSIDSDIYAAGDIVHFWDSRAGKYSRIEHWRIALQQGRVAAHNMAGKKTAFTEVPFFWTTQFDATLNYVGHAEGWDEIIVDGKIAEKDFLAFYVKDGLVTAVAGMNHDKELAYFEELMRLYGGQSVKQLKERLTNFSRADRETRGLSQSGKIS
jgi:NADPH-dependent 2,4-dienoyl-CoA reductase/sulfur reductase-like enzyme/nitrite reductase/ring-hydroxylating ferredoxin subunit